jgi:hypothetical protein
MTFIGKVVKGTLSLTEKFSLDARTAIERQEEQLRTLLKTARDTAFGKYYDFASLLSEDNVLHAYRERVPLHNYDSINERWWLQQRRFPDITWPGKPDYFALTSGTTGSESKRIPVTEAFIQSMRQVGMTQLAALAKMDLPETIFSSEALIISSSGNLDEKNGHLEGEISGINVSKFPEWYELFYRPGKEIAMMDDWEERTEAIARHAAEWNIGAIAGIPSWVQLCLKKVLSTQGAGFVDEVWPDASLFVSGGVAFKTYDESFRSLFSKPIYVVDTYLASEGFFAYGITANDLQMKMALSHGYYFEFIPFDEQGFESDGSVKADPVCLTIDEVQEGEEYALVVTTCAGAWRYLIGDTVVFTDIDEKCIRITGRTKFFLNVVGSQLSEEKLDAAVQHISKKTSCEINEYAVACVRDDGKYYHQWILICDDDLPESKVEKWIDGQLQEANNNYQVARAKALEGVHVAQLTKDQYSGWLKKNNKLGGQVKVQKVMSAEDMRTFMEYVRSVSS